MSHLAGRTCINMQLYGALTSVVGWIVATGYYPESVRLCQSFIRHKSTLVSPSVLKQNAIPYDKVFVFVVTFCMLCCD